MDYDVDKIREKFPIFKNNPNLIYMNSASTSLVPKEVIDSIRFYYEKSTANLERGVDKYSYKNSLKFEKSRNKISEFINASEKSEIIFTRGTTESINILANNFFRYLLKKDDEIILNVAEHNSNLLPWINLSKNNHCNLKYATLDNFGSLDTKELPNLLNEKTKLISFSEVTNVLGSKNDVHSIVKIIRKYAPNAYIVVDGAQGVIEAKVDVQYYDCDFYVFSGHKLYGPTGIGVLYGKRKYLELINPYHLGGGSAIKVNKYDFVLSDIPKRLESGTMMISEVYGLSSSIDFLTRLDKNKCKNHIFKLRKYFINKLKEIKDIILYNEYNVNSHTIVFNVKNIHSHDIASLLSENNISVRAGDHCSHLLKEFIKINTTVRISLSIYNKKEEIDKVVEVLCNSGEFIDVFL